tara:strand:+ start:26 stop:871 length:846 start_codon:yes stop_codon:yes gene_type:complete
MTLKLPKIIGHRGVISSEPGYPYQNSIEAYKIALDRMNGFETDACLNADGNIYFIHEAKYLKTPVEISYQEHLKEPKSTDKERFDLLTDNDISNLKLKGGEQIPSWDDVIPLFKDRPDKIFNIELKGYKVHKVLIPKLRKAFDNGDLLEEQVLISSFAHPFLKEIRKAFPNIAIGMLFIDPNIAPALLFPWTDDQECFYTPILEKTLQSKDFDQIKPQFIIIPDSCANEHTFSIIKKYHEDKKVIVWVFTELDNYDDQSFKAMVKKYQDMIYTIIVDKPWD